MRYQQIRVVPRSLFTPRPYQGEGFFVPLSAWKSVIDMLHSSRVIVSYWSSLMESNVSVLKFGGTSVGNGERIRHVVNILAHKRNDPEEAFPIVVVSAMSGVTDQLLRIAHYSTTRQHKECEHELRALKQRHLEAAENVVHSRRDRQVLLHDLEMAFSALEQDAAALQSAAERDVPLLLPALAAWGERLSVLLVAAAACETGVQAKAVREEVIITNHPTCSIRSLHAPSPKAHASRSDEPKASRDNGVSERLQRSRDPAALAHGFQESPDRHSTRGAGFHEEPFYMVARADPLPAETRANAQALIHPLIEQQIVPIVAGFIGRSITGFVTTLGRNGSDHSASVIGAALDCVEVSIYTDVDGVMTADPHIVMNARLLPRLSYTEATHLSWFGAKVLHPHTLLPLAQRNIPVRVCNTFRPLAHGTVIGPEETQHSGARAITVRHQLALITVESKDMFGATENAEQVFALAAHAGGGRERMLSEERANIAMREGTKPVAICSSSGHHLSFLVEELAVDSVVALLQQERGAWRVLCRRGLAACACIDSGFTTDPMSSARAITALARERIPVVTQGTSELGIILVVEDPDSERALCCLHRDLIAPVIPLVHHSVQEKCRAFPYPDRQRTSF